MSATLTPPPDPAAVPMNGAMPPMPAGGAGSIMALGAPPEMALASIMMPKRPDPSAPHKAQLARWIAMTNIATDEDIEADLERLAARVKADYDIDDRSRADWKTKYRKWLDFALQIAEPKTYPWPSACYSLDTDILTESGWKPVADIGIGEKVFSRAPDGSAAFYPVTERHRFTSLAMVHFRGKSIDLLVTPNHRMLVESKFGKRKKQHFIEASRFLEERLAFRYIPLTSHWKGKAAPTVHGIDARAYARFLGSFISDGSCFTARNKHTLKDGTIKDYGLSYSSFSLAKNTREKPEQHESHRRIIEACGFTCKETPTGFIVHAKSMPQTVKDELRSFGLSGQKSIPAHIMSASVDTLEALLAGLVGGDGYINKRQGREDVWSYTTASACLADQIQEVCQKIGWRGTISRRAAARGGVINGRDIVGTQDLYSVQINRKTRIQVVKMDREAVTGPCEVACVTVEPHHTLYVRRNGKALWCGNSNIIYPLMTTAAIQFAARAYPAIIRDRDVVKGVVIGDDSGEPVIDPRTGQPAMGPQGPVMAVPPGARQDRANLIGRHMSWQLLDEQEEWEPQTDQLLIVLPIVGVMFRKSYFDPSLGRNVSETVDALNLVVNYTAKSFETAPRHTELIRLYPWEIEEAIRAGLFLDEEYGHDQDGTDQDDDDAPTTFLEQHRRWDLDDDGYAEPYIVTIARDSGKLARIRTGFEFDGIEWAGDGRVKKIEKIAYYTKYGFIPSPDSRVYDLGFGNLLFPINEAVNTTLNQMFDAGHLQNVGGGFVGSGLSINTGALRFQMGEYKPVNTLNGNIRDNVFPLPFPGPNPILMQLLSFLVEAGERVASVKDVMVGDMPGDNTSGITTLAVIEQGLKVFSAIYKRIHRSLGYEFKKLYRLNRIYGAASAHFQDGDIWREIKREDYELTSGVAPVSDPQMVTDMQRLGRAQFLLGFKDDTRVNGAKVIVDAFKAAMIPQPEQYMVQARPQPDPKMLLKARELDIRETNEMVSLQLRAAREKAAIIGEIAKAELALAQARKLDNDAQLGWVINHLEYLRAQVDAIPVLSTVEDQSGPPGPKWPGSAPAPAGGQPGAMGDVAPPPGDQPFDALPAGLPGGVGAPNPGPMDLGPA